MMKKDKNKYFGPFTSAGAVKDTIELIHKIYHIRTCTRKLPQDIGKDRPCLYYHIHQCDAPCQGYVSKEEYQQSVKQALDFLGGRYEPVMKYLEDRMTAASEEMEFEKAIEYRELLGSVRKVAQKQKITSQSIDDRDIIAMAKDERGCRGTGVLCQGWTSDQAGNISICPYATAEEDGQILNSFVKQFYCRDAVYPPGSCGCRRRLDDAEVIGQLAEQPAGARR